MKDLHDLIAVSFCCFVTWLITYCHMDDKRAQAIRKAFRDEEAVRAYSVPLVDAFHQAARSYPEITIDPDVMAGAPCVQGTRIPVYMVLDAIEYQGSIEAALESYPRLTLDQVKEAIGFAKLVVECPIEHEDTVTS